MISVTTLLIIINSSDILDCDMEHGDWMGFTYGLRSINDPPLARELNATDLEFFTHMRDETFHESEPLVFLNCPVPINLHHLDLSNTTVVHGINPEDVSTPFHPDQQIIAFDNSGMKESGVQQHSCLQIVCHCSGQAPLCRSIGKHMLGIGNGNCFRDCFKSLSSQPCTTKRGTSLLRKQDAQSKECSAFVQTKRCFSGGQDSTPKLVTSTEVTASDWESKSQQISLNIFNSFVELSNSSVEHKDDGQEKASRAVVHYFCPSIYLTLSQMFGTAECSVSSHLRVLLDRMFSIPCSLEEQNEQSLNHQNLVVELSPASAIPEDHGYKVASVLLIPNLSATKLVITKQYLHNQVKVLVPNHPVYNQVDGSSSWPVAKSDIKAVKLSVLPLSYSDNFQNNMIDCVEGRIFVGWKYSAASPLLNKSKSWQDIHHLSDVACCSSRLPPKQVNRVAYMHVNIDNVTYAQDDNAKLFQGPVMEDSDREQTGANSLERCGCSDVDRLNLWIEGEGDNLRLESKHKIRDLMIESYSSNTDYILQDFEVLKADDMQFEDFSIHSQALQRSSIISLACNPVSNALLEPLTNSYICKWQTPVLEESNHDKCLGQAVKCTITSSIDIPDFSEKWNSGNLCDLCNTGPSLSLGEWFAWCCGLPASRCQCPEQKKMKKQMNIGFRKIRKLKTKGRKTYERQWTGKVHKMCALWSSEVFEKENQRKGSHLRLLDAAVKRGNSILCRDPECRKAGATLGCRVKNCRRSYHYPCAERLASRCLLRMWDCLTIPIACGNHRYVEFEMDRAKEKLLPASVTYFDRDWKTPIPNRQHYLGCKLLSEDIAEGQEAVQIPCTNDVDDDPVPNFKYITKCWCKGYPVDNLHPVGTELAKGCQGCDGANFDCWSAPMSVHILGTTGGRESDKRLDWQSEFMYGRLPYNAYGLLQLGAESKDIIECNSRCKCGPQCKNRELQKGLQVHLELFKTTDRGWGVRTLQQIPRGRFVVEYVGDVLTQAEADEQAEKYDENQLSYLFNLDHPGVDHEDSIVLDGIYMSNIARFINHSCEGNLMIYRVYSETTVTRYFRIGMYAIQDLEVGDELSYDYNYAVSKEWTGFLIDDPTAIRCCCGAESCRNWLWLGGNESQLN